MQRTVHSKLGSLVTIITHVPMFLWNLCVHLRAFALMTRGVKSVEITSLKTSNVCLHFVCVFDSPSRLTAVAKMKNFPVCGKLGFNMGLPECNPSSYTT